MGVGKLAGGCDGVWMAEGAGAIHTAATGAATGGGKAMGVGLGGGLWLVLEPGGSPGGGGGGAASVLLLAAMAGPVDCNPGIWAAVR